MIGGPYQTLIRGYLVFYTKLVFPFLCLRDFLRCFTIIVFIGSDKRAHADWWGVRPGSRCSFPVKSAAIPHGRGGGGEMILVHFLSLLNYNCYLYSLIVGGGAGRGLKNGVFSSAVLPQNGCQSLPLL